MKTILVLWLSLTAGISATWQQNEIAAVLIGEAGGEGFEGMRAVAAVIRNRAQYRKCTIHQEISRRGSFAAYRTIHTYLHRLRTHKHKDLALRLVEALEQRPGQLGSPVNGADHYDGVGRNPSWSRGRQPVKVVGRHKFYRLYVRSRS